MKNDWFFNMKYRFFCIFATPLMIFSLFPCPGRSKNTCFSNWFFIGFGKTTKNRQGSGKSEKHRKPIVFQLENDNYVFEFFQTPKLNGFCSVFQNLRKNNQEMIACWGHEGIGNVEKTLEGPTISTTNVDNTLQRATI